MYEHITVCLYRVKCIRRAVSPRLEDRRNVSSEALAAHFAGAEQTSSDVAG